MTARHQVVIVGGGFGGLAAAKALRRAPVEVTVVDRQAHHLFQPLLYQVATGVLSQGNIAPPLRDVLRHPLQRAAAKLERMGVEIRTGTRVTGIDAAGVELKTGDGVERLAAMTKIWSAGVQASPLGSMLAAQAGVDQLVGRSRPERTITAQQIFARGAVAASIGGDDLGE